jgi:MFS family permease
MEKGRDQTESDVRIYYGHIIVAISFFIIAIMWGGIYCYGVFFEPLRSDFGWTNAQTSGAYSLYMILHGVCYVITGKLNDQFGSRIVMTACGILLGIGYLLMSRIASLWQLYLIYGLIIAMGMSGGFVPLISTVAKWFVTKRSLMTGIGASGVGVGTMIMPPIANWLISSYGWRASFFVIGIISLFLIVLLSQFLKRNPAESAERINEKDRMKERSMNLPVGKFTLNQAIHTSQFWMVFIMFLGFGFYVQTIMIHIVIYAKNLEPLLANPAFILTIIGALSITGRVLMGASGDRIGNRAVAVIGFSLMVFGACLLMVFKIWTLYLFGAIFGFAYGGLVAIQSPLIADLFGLRSHGSILGIIVFAVTIGGSIGPSFAGYMLDLTNSYYTPFLVLTIISGISLALILLLRPTNYQKLNTQLQ